MPATVRADDGRLVSAPDNWVACIMPVHLLRSMLALSGKHGGCVNNDGPPVSQQT